MAIRLSHGDRVRLSTWVGPYADNATAVVGTSRGFAASHGRDPQAAHDRARANGHVTAFTTFYGFFLFGDGRSTEEAIALAKVEAAKATVLDDGDMVEIEGEIFMVFTPAGNDRGPRNFDPIHFSRNSYDGS
jgi:hypothetical protein